METKTTTIHRALAELKLIDAKINKSIINIEPVGFKQKDKFVNNFYKDEEFNKTAKARLQSVQDLIELKHRIKSAITKANAKTKVKIGTKEMTISEAINFKSIIGYKKELIESLTTKLNKVKQKIESYNTDVEENALRIAETALQKDNVKINDKDAINITKPYIEINEYKLIDPLKIEPLIEELTDEVELFETEVDAVLSEINAVTMIEY